MESIERIVALVAGADQDDAGPVGGGTEGEDAPPVLAKVKEAPGNVSLETMLTEIDKLLTCGRSGCRRICSSTSRRRWWPAGGRGPR
ncbi:hypothetical protein [Streptomyces sp. NPDC059994]|uniref:hypothetical protein n=1 Tax=Streptomyces sp. NPDC059994 TaxID=3347029 RepID=UPI00367F8C66